MMIFLATEFRVQCRHARKNVQLQPQVRDSSPGNCEQGISAYRSVMNALWQNNRFSAACHRIQVPWIDTDTNKDMNKTRNDVITLNEFNYLLWWLTYMKLNGNNLE